MVVSILSFLTLQAFSQRAVLNNGDTNICFTVTQSKFLLKEHYRAIEMQKLDSICELKSSFKDSIIRADAKIISDFSMIVKNKDEAIGLKQYEVDKLNTQLKVEQKRVRIQKVYKWDAIVIGTATTSFMTYQYLKK